MQVAIAHSVVTRPCREAGAIEKWSSANLMPGNPSLSAVGFGSFPPTGGRARAALAVPPNVPGLHAQPQTKTTLLALQSFRERREREGERER